MASETSLSQQKADSSPPRLRTQPIPPPRKKLTPKLMEWCSDNLENPEPKDDAGSLQKPSQLHEVQYNESAN